jgi:hypothetical protein
MPNLPTDVNTGDTGHEAAHEALHAFYNHLNYSVPVIISAVNPGFTQPGLWLKNLGTGNFELWIEDGLP